jgi:Tfp pilus assembly PilM family ATPase
MALAELLMRTTRRVRGWWTVAPDVGVYIGTGFLSVAAVESVAGGYRLLTAAVETLPDGIVVPSPVEPNIRQPQAVIDRLKAARAASHGLREVAISLPDPTVRVAILDLARLPARRTDREALFQYHFEQLFLNTLGRCRFAFQRLMPLPSGRERVLVAAIKEEILEEYESVVRAAGLLPAVVDISAFHLYNLYEEQIAASLSSAPCALFLNMFDRNFTIILVDQHGPRSIRTKAVHTTMTEAELMARMMTEIDSSIQSAQPSHTSSQASPLQTSDDELQPVARLFVFSDRPLHDLDREISAAYQMETTRLRSNGHAEMPGSGQAVIVHADGDDSDRPAVTTALAAAVGRRSARS